jgi:hypothetical protein
LAKAGILVMRGRLVDVQASDAVPDDEPKPQASELHAAASRTAEKLADRLIRGALPATCRLV